MAIRADEVVAEFYKIDDPQQVLPLVTQMLKEATEWLERYPYERCARIWVPAYKAAFDALVALKNRLDADPDLQKELGEKHAKVMAAIEATAKESEAMGPGVIVKAVPN